MDGFGADEFSLKRQRVGYFAVLRLGAVAEHDQIPGDTAGAEFTVADRETRFAERIDSPGVTETAGVSSHGKIAGVGHLHPAGTVERPALPAEVIVQETPRRDVECRVGTVFAPSVEITEDISFNGSVWIMGFHHQFAENAVIVRILEIRRGHLLEIVDAVGAVRPFPRLIERGQKKRGEDGDDHYYYQ